MSSGFLRGGGDLRQEYEVEGQIYILARPLATPVFDTFEDPCVWTFFFIIFLKEEQKSRLKASLANLPTPSNDFEIVVPEVEITLYIVPFAFL